MDSSAERRFRLWLALVCAVASVLPNLYAAIAAPPGSLYLGTQYNTDDHMVYAAWTHQSMDGQLLFDNRFTVDPQPRLTFHLYFLALGWIAKVTGIPLAAALARFVLSGTFVWMLCGFVWRIAGRNGFIARTGPVLAVIGAGLGFTVWHTFGTEIVRATPPLLRSLMLGRLPIDVWQPEAFGLSSMLTSGLFVAALCLILATFNAMLDAQDSWRPVLPGALAFGALMNIHSYDALLVALVMVGFLATAVAQKTATPAWMLRAACIGAGALPAALWFLHVLSNDPVFQARAATPTFSPNFRGMVFGLAGLVVLALVGLWLARNDDPVSRKRVTLGTGLAVGMGVAGFVGASAHEGGYWMGPVAWGLAFAACLAVLALVSRPLPAWNLLVAWAFVGTLAPYFPALFQRKLAMGLGIPWAILAVMGLAPILARTESGKRQVGGVLAILLLSASSVMWVARQFWFIRNNVANTTVHPVYVGSDVQTVLDALNQVPDERVVVLAMPGIPSPLADEAGDPLPDEFGTPYMPDLNPILSGFAGTYAYAGHWSETPNYAERRNALTQFFLARTDNATRAALLRETGAQFVVAPVPEAFPMLPLADLRPLGKVILDGTQFRLIDVR
ncbi:MAG: hypothetical protein M9921_15665 [Fimbriimonadaceae bacterium]|nr:hypothetical protein [Fimbriimonadaceae bacterium]